MYISQNILLVDDSRDDIELMRAAFNEAGFNVPIQEVHNGVEAIAYLRGDAPYDNRDRFPLPTLMLLDLNMPMKNGIEVLNWVREQPGLRRLRIIVLTASTRMEDVEQAFDRGANSFLVKPGTFAELIAMVRILRDWLRINQFASLRAT